MHLVKLSATIARFNGKLSVVLNLWIL